MYAHVGCFGKSSYFCFDMVYANTSKNVSKNIYPLHNLKRKIILLILIVNGVTFTYKPQ